MKSTVDTFDKMYFEPGEGEQSPLSDEEYDAVKKLSGASHVGFTDSRGRVTHDRPMLSLAKAHTVGDMNKFMNTVHNASLYAQVKLDGLAISLIYDGGVLVRAVTRGDGVRGEDMTSNVAKVDDIPKTLPADKRVEVRGEIYMHKSRLADLNKVSDKEFKNTRNAAVGILRSASDAYAGYLSFAAYECDISEGYTVNSQLYSMEIAERHGIPTVPMAQMCTGYPSVIAFYDQVSAERHELDYDIDGVVYKVNNTEIRDSLGSSSSSPNWAIAYKFEPEKLATTIESVTWQVGASGALTPVAKVTPTNINGVTITNVTLHNQLEIARKGIRLGSTVILERAGDVIPHIDKVLPGDQTTTSIVSPTSCPSCGWPVQNSNDLTIVRCTRGFKCEEQLIGLMKKFASRDAMDINGLGEGQIRTLLKAGMIDSIIDILDIPVNKDLQYSIEALPGFGDKSVAKLVYAINDAMFTTMPRVMYSLGIRHLGRSLSKDLSLMVTTIKDLRNLSIETLMGIDGVGVLTATSIIADIKSPYTQLLLQSLDDVVVFTSYATSNTGPLHGKKIVFTGALEGSSRSEAEKEAEAMGATVSKSISIKVDFVVIGSNAGQKREQAEQLEGALTILTENDWDEMCAEHAALNK